jgi:hypothetical protein
MAMAAPLDSLLFLVAAVVDLDITPQLLVVAQVAAAQAML